jgi:anthranilate synthase/aminodeoxychorismate synthase-like glutamine amidotransferase
MILLIDNYDSFTYNLVQRLGEIDPQIALEVHRNDQITLDEIAAKKPTHLIVSPGPCTPKEAGVSCDVISRFYRDIPILGVCLGHQSIGHAFGAEIVRARRLMHGKTDQIFHDGRGLFAGLDSPLEATRYHSLVIRPGTLSDEFEVAAWAAGPPNEDGPPDEQGRLSGNGTGEPEIMGVRHKKYPLHGVQFHPESFLTLRGTDLLKTFLQLS